MKKLVLFFMMFFPLMAYCQTETETEKYYIYNIVSFVGEFTKENFKVYYDDGKEVKRLRNDKDTKMRFSTPAGALMYFISQGWEMYLNGSTTQGSAAAGYGSSETSSYWILRKPCTKEEFEKAVNEAVKK
jgi:hypothetical protein